MPSLIFTIGEVAQLAGVTPKTLRHYHQIGLLPEPARDANNYRVYSIDQLEKVQLILRLKDIGLSLKRIKSIFEANDPDTLMRTVLHQHERRITNEISELLVLPFLVEILMLARCCYKQVLQPAFPIQFFVEFVERRDIRRAGSSAGAGTIRQEIV